MDKQVNLSDYLTPDQRTQLARGEVVEATVAIQAAFNAADSQAGCVESASELQRRESDASHNQGT